MKNDRYDVIIIGGGITGAGTARDCAMRGLKVLLVERSDIATGATGRNHGLLHSGARYAVTDRESAAECISENRILRRIAAHCVEDTQGFFITLPEDDLGYQAGFIEACRAAGIEAEAVDPREAILAEPSVNPDIIGAVKVPDGSVDPFRLCASNMLDARLHGADILIYHEVTAILKEGDTVVGIETVNRHGGEKNRFYADITINAAGIWGHHIASLAGANIGMYPAKGALLIFAHRINKVVINRCRKPANGDILVPGDTVSVIGTTSSRVPFEECDHIAVTPDEVDLLLTEGAKLAPVIATTRVLRAYAGVRPLVSADNDPSGRNISRGIVRLDHESRDGIKGFISITGGKLMTYRLMAEMATDLACKKLGVGKPCLTAVTPLPGSENGGFREALTRLWDSPSLAQKAAVARIGARAGKLGLDLKTGGHLLCECEGVSTAEALSAVKDSSAGNIVDLRRRTRLGMGTCQGGICAYRAAGLLSVEGTSPSKARRDLKEFLEERWKGVRPICWGQTLRESEYSRWVYRGLTEDVVEDKK